MTSQNRAQLKALFETGDTLAQSSFENLIDSCLNISDTSPQTIASQVTFSEKVTTTALSTTIVSASSITTDSIVVSANVSANIIYSNTAIVSAGRFTTVSASTPVNVSTGGTGISTVSAYSILCGGTTNTGAFQAVSTQGTSGQVLTSNGANALPTWQNATTGILSSVYPIGSYYINETDSTNPATLFGFGTWVAVTDRFIIGASGTYSAGSTGGATTHTLTTAEIPALTYTFSGSSAGGAPGPTTAYVGNLNNSTTTNLSATSAISTNAGGGSHSILNPYIAAYIWKRTA